VAELGESDKIRKYFIMKTEVQILGEVAEQRKII
jgi:hypothetical protein